MKNPAIRQYLQNILTLTPKRVKRGIEKDGIKLNNRIIYSNIKKYIDVFLSKDTDNRFIIMPGLRGTGKTTILYQLYDYLYVECDIKENQILYLNLDRLKDFENFDIQDYLDEFITGINEEHTINYDPLFIFVDESQYSNNWGHVGKIIFDEFPNVFLIFTGSDALNLEYNYESARRSLKKQVYPLNFQELLKLKYRSEFDYNLTNEFYNLIFTGEVENLQKIEKNIQNNVFIPLNKDLDNIWLNYVQFEGFPFSLNDNAEEIIEKTINMKDRIIEKDFDIVSSFTSPIRLASYKLLNILAMQKPGESSANKLANILNISRTSIYDILDALEKTQLVFPIKPYGSVTKRERQSGKYYFLSTQIKSCINKENGQTIGDFNDYMGNLSENLVASSLFKLKEEKSYNFGIFYDPKKGGVDFLLKTLMDDIIPIEVGFGKKTKKQIKKAISNYKSDYGIVISNTTSTIEKEDDVIFIPLITFSLL